jgi:hypothetical protein|tara:strand:+ start:105 stop:575 length:471 start_codon:yes stop_codon:yes gene_type:complete
MSKMGWESAKREMKRLSRNGKYVKLSIKSHSSYYILPYRYRYMSENQTTQKHKPAFAKNELRKVHQVDYHRNGISGIGFYSVRYDWADYDGIERRMLATITAEKESVKDELGWYQGKNKNYYDISECRVIDIDDPSISWRGDSLAPKIINMIEGSK